jgi:hypothetical protein
VANQKLVLGVQQWKVELNQTNRSQAKLYLQAPIALTQGKFFLVLTNFTIQIRVFRDGFSLLQNAIFPIPNTTMLLETQLLDE